MPGWKLRGRAIALHRRKFLATVPDIYKSISRTRGKVEHAARSAQYRMAVPYFAHSAVEHQAANGWPFTDCQPAPGLGRFTAAATLVPFISHSPIAPLVFWNSKSACPFSVK
jgi:hypothetical protein